MSVFERFTISLHDALPIYHLRLERFLLVRRFESVARCSPRRARRGDFFPVIEQAMSITPIVFILVILLFGLDSPDRSRAAKRFAEGITNFLKCRSSKA